MKNFIILYLFTLIGCNKILQVYNSKIEKNSSVIDLKNLLDEYIILKENREGINQKVNEIKDFLNKNSPPSPFYKDALMEIGKYVYRKENNKLLANYGFENIKKYFNENSFTLIIDIKNESWLHIFYPDVKYIDALFEIGLDINEENSFGENLLHRACCDNNLDLIKFLISKKIEINKKENRLGFTPLFFALKNFDKDIIDFLLANDIDILALDNEGRTILHHIAIHFFLNSEELNDEEFINTFKEIFTKVLEKGISLLEVKDIKGKTFYNYLNNKNLNTFKHKKYDSFHNNFKEKQMNSILDFLIFCSNLNNFIKEDLLKKIIENHRILNTKNQEIKLKVKEVQIGSSTLIKYDSILLFKLIFKEKEKFILENINHFILSAVKEQSLEILEFLLDKIDNIDFLFQVKGKDIKLLSLIYFIIENNNKYFFELLLSKTTDINKLNKKVTYFYIEPHSHILNEIIFKTNNMQMFEKILDRKELDVNLKDELGYTPLHHAVEFNKIEMAKKLLEKGASITEINNDGNNPFDIALIKYFQTPETYSEICELLNKRCKELKISCIAYLKWNCRTSSFSFNKKNSDFASSFNLIVRSLSEKHSNSSLLKFIEEGDYKNFEDSLNKNPSLINQDYLNENLLSKAIKKGRKEMVQLLLKMGADILFDKVSEKIYNAIKKEEFFSMMLPKIKFSPLHICINIQNIEFLSILLPYIKEEVKFKVLKYSLNILSLECFELIFNTILEVEKKKILNLLFLNSLNKLKLKQIEFLLERFKDIIDLNYDVLSLVISKRSIELIDLLSESGIKFNIESTAGYYLSYESIKIKDKALILKLRDIGAFNVESQENNLLHYYINLLISLEENSKEFSNLLDEEFIKFLIKELYLDLNKQDENGFNILHLACKSNNFKIIKIILNIKIRNYSIDVNLKDNKGNTPLHLLTLGFKKFKNAWPIEKIKKIILIFMDNNLDTKIQNLKNEKIKDILNKSPGKCLIDLLEKNASSEITFSDEE